MLYLQRISSNLVLKIWSGNVISFGVATKHAGKAYKSASTFSRAPTLRFPILKVMFFKCSAGKKNSSEKKKLEDYANFQTGASLTVTCIWPKFKNSSI